MKKFFLLLILMGFVFVSCSSDDDYSLDNYVISIATVENPDNSSFFYLKLDDNTLLGTAVTYYPNYRPKTGQRIIANYTLLGKTPEGSSYDYDIRLNDAYNILTKGVFDITPQTQDSIGNDPVVLRELWVGSDFLNVDFYYKGNNKTHFITLAYDASKVYTDGKVHLELRHNAHNDEAKYIIHGIASFNLTSLQSLTATKSLDLVIHVKDYDGKESTYDVKYDFEIATPTVKEFDKNYFNDYKGSNME